MLRLQQKYLIGTLILFLTIGGIGLTTPFNETFEKLSFYNLLLTLILLLLSVKKDFSKFFVVLTGLFFIGFIAELIGVQTGILFGEYQYNNNLGFKLADVPLIIGFNWAMLSIGAYFIVARFFENSFIKITIASLLMVAFDFLMEPVAIHLDFWSWKTGEIPFYNYITWFLVSIVQMLVLCNFKIDDYGIAKVIFLAQFVFFLWLNFWI